METTCRVTELKITYKNTNIGLQHKMYIMGLEHMMLNYINYRKNSNIIRTIFTTNRGLVVGVRIIHVN